MPHAPMWRRYLRFWRPDIDADIDEELRFHLEARAEELRARGLPAEEASRIAGEEFGDVEATRRRLREIDERLERRRERERWWGHLRGDLRFTLRGLRTTPLFTVGVVLALSVGLGAAAAMYGTMRRLLLQPPPHVVAPEQLARPYFHYQLPEGKPRLFDRLSYPFYERMRDGVPGVGSVAAYEPGVEIVVGMGSDARTAHATLVSAGFWRTLGTRPLLGRFITDEEAHPATGARVVVLGHAYWQRRFGGDRAVVGTTLHLRGIAYQVIGVAPRGFRGVEWRETDLWLPLHAAVDVGWQRAKWHTLGGSANMKFVVRPASGASRAGMESALGREHALMIFADEPGLTPEGVMARPRTHVTLEEVTRPIDSRGRRLTEATVTVWLVGVAALLLLIACANVASLLLLRALRRRREIAVRLALGMTRGRLVAMLLLESALLSLLGAAGAAALAAIGGAWVRRVLLPNMVGESAGFDWRTLAAAAGAMVLTALLTGLAPVLQTRRDVAGGLRDGAQHGATRRSTLYWGLLVSQTALSAVLLVGSGLFLRSLHRVTTMDLGVDTVHGLVVSVDFLGSGRTKREVAAFHERALERLRAIPGVRSASLATSAPLRGASGMLLRTHPGGEWVQTENGTPLGSEVAGDYFDAVGMRIVAGRGITTADRTGAPVVVVNEALARLAWPGRSPIGECAYLAAAPDQCARVAGVARNAHTFRIREEQLLAMYVPLPPDDTEKRVLLVRVAPEARGIEGTIARAVQALDPVAPYVDVERLGDALNPEIRPWRLGAAVFTLFGALAALLAALGLYAAMAYAVTQRTREIGVRVAVGATVPRIMRLVFGDALRVTAAGIAAGLALALAAAPRIATLLFETPARDPLVFGAVALTLLAAASVATLQPAIRATRVDPTEALRNE
ncbi:MAG TPA: ADOP family duplicated permease [Gemmatimonadaceae bacterium]|nr:ADOP family duplicated permease [Gemmatimonadaceae bacterium]